MRQPVAAALQTLLAALLVTACAEVEEIFPGFGEPLTPREAYVAALDSAGLAGTALVADWVGAGDRALQTPIIVEPPLSEDGYFAPERPAALAWRMRVQRGRRIEVAARLEPDTTAILFVDVFEVSEYNTDSLRHVLSAERGRAGLEFEPRRDGEYVLRIQPELLRGGRYHIEVRAVAALAFPVQDHTSRNIQSVFGDARDGGRRNHHGVDIFAPRGTPVLAAGAGRVRAVRTTPRGGNVVWLTDERRGLRLYYAHLDSQTVTDGQVVEIGDTLGFVGNTGNARTTPPHLHFGIYRRGEGPIDPWWFIYDIVTPSARLAVDTTTFGEWTRTTAADVRLRAGPDTDAPRIAQLPRHTALIVVGGTGSWYRVALPDGTEGFVAARLTESADSPVRSARLARVTPLSARPAPGAATIDELEPGEVPVLAEFGEYLLVRPAGLPTGWVTGA